jgi:hypothetical protein
MRVTTFTLALVTLLGLGLAAAQQQAPRLRGVSVFGGSGRRAAAGRDSCGRLPTHSSWEEEGAEDGREANPCAYETHNRLTQTMHISRQNLARLLADAEPTDKMVEGEGDKQISIFEPTSSDWCVRGAVAWGLPSCMYGARGGRLNTLVHAS